MVGYVRCPIMTLVQTADKLHMNLSVLSDDVIQYEQGRYDSLMIRP